MPPKKLTKAEKDRLKREEAERVAHEEEELRKKEEEERRLKEEQEAREREEKEKLEAEEKARLHEENEEVLKIKNSNNDKVEEWRKKLREKEEWVHYLSCSSLPLVTDERSINTYISMYREQPSSNSLNESLTRITDVLKLINEFERLQIEEEEATTTSKHYQLYELIEEELDHVTMCLMEEPSKHIDNETFNLIVEDGIPNLEYCLWGNIVKDPRLKNFSFKTRNFTLELPKPLLLADVAIRVLYPTYDSITPLSKRYSCFSVPSTAASTSNPEENEEISGTGEGEKSEVGDGGSIVESKAGSRISSAKSSIESQNQNSERGDKEDEEKEDEEKTVVTSEDQASTKNETEDDELQDDEIDLRCYRPAGGLILLDLLTLPPQPKVFQDWILKQVMTEGLKKYPHPVDLTGAVLPVTISMNLPEHYYFLDVESLQLAIWDSDKMIWRTNGLKDVTFDLSGRTVSFQTLLFAPMAIMTDIYINFPYQSWELLPLGLNHTHLHIIGGVVEITISIKGDECMLIHPSEESLVMNILNKPLSPVELIKALSSVGYYFFPEADAEKYTSLTSKKRVLEDGVYECMSMCIGIWGFQWSQWNHEGGRERLIVRGTQCSSEQWKLLQNDNPDIEKLAWNLYISGETTYQLLMTEDSETFTDTIAHGHETHSDLYTTLMKSSTTDYMTGTDPVHIHTVEQWLKATQPLSST